MKGVIPFARMAKVPFAWTVRMFAAPEPVTVLEEFSGSNFPDVMVKLPVMVRSPLAVTAAEVVALSTIMFPKVIAVVGVIS